MKKTFLNVALISSLLVSMPVSFTSCKDYDDDITSINSENDAMSKQIAALETALKATQDAANAAAQAAATAQQAAKDAAATGDKALAASQEAKAEAAAAMQAAQEAKADAIKAALAAIEELKGSLATQETLDALTTRVEAIEKGLSTLTGTVNAHDNALRQMQTQIDALKKYESLLESLVGVNGKIDALETKVSSIEDAIGKINQTMNTLSTDIESINTALSTLTTQVQAINGNLVTFITGRLSSVTLVPDLFIDGIETIEFTSLSYQPMNPKTLKREGANIIVSTEENPAHYRLNPTSTALKDIDADNIEFVALTAESRGVATSPIAYVKGSASIATTGLERGILTVNAKKTITGTLNSPAGKPDNIYAVALKVPIAAAHLQDAATPEYVYSEYSRLHELTLTPSIAALPYKCTATAHNHYSDSTTIWQSSVVNSALVTKEVAYDGEIDLMDLVTGCLDGTNKQITKEELAKYGMEFRFGLPTTKYTSDAENNTDQQEFVRFKEGSSSVVVSKTPAGLLNNRASAGKQPIVRIVLFDKVNKKLVDQRYLKIKWSEKTVDPVDLGTKEFVNYLGCKDVTVTRNWRDFTNDIYAVIKDGKIDMSKEQFTKVYLGEGSPKIEGSYDDPNVVFDGNAAADAAAITWTLTPDEIGTIVKYDTSVTPHTWSLTKNVFSVKMTFTPNNLDYPVLTYTLKQTIDVKDAPAINGFYDNYWVTPYTKYAVYPVQYGSAAQNTLGNQTCVYHNNLMNGFTFFEYKDKSRFIIKNLTDCATWDMQFCRDHQLKGYLPAYTGAEPDKSLVADNGGYFLNDYTTDKTNGVNAAKLVWADGHTAWNRNSAHNETYVELVKNAEGIALLGNNAHVGVWATINQYNYLPVFDYDINFVKPLILTEGDIEGNFVDGVVNGSRIDWTKAFVLRDCFGYAVAAKTTGTGEKEKYAAELYKYYEVQTPQWDTENIKFGMKIENGNVVVNPDATIDNAITAEQLKAVTTGGVIPSLTVDGDELVFTSNMGSQVTSQFYIWVKVTVQYGWGSGELWVRIAVKPMNS